MRIAYVLEVNPFEESGIVKKVNDQVAYWRRKGHHVTLFLSWPKPRKPKPIYVEGEHIKSGLVNFLPESMAKNYLNKILSRGKLRKAIKNFSPDILYTRQNTWYPGMGQHLKENRTILELNTVDAIEVKFYSPLKRKLYLMGRKRVLKYASALLSVSPDILLHYQDYEKLEKEVISNGINLGRVKKIRDKPPGKINLIFVGSKNFEWHGLNRIIDLAWMLPEYNFNIVGYNSSGTTTKIPDNIRFYGWMNKKQLEGFYSQNHIGIGSFGNKLVGKAVDSTLKVREYLAYGLPVILGHKDVDFLGKEDFILKVTDDNDDFIPIDEIRGFLEKNKEIMVSNDQIAKIDSEAKEEERLAFFRKIADKSR